MSRKRLDYNLREQTPGERLWLKRKSQKKTQARAAADMRVSRPVYWAMETDRRPIVGWHGTPLKLADDWSHLLPLARRRSGLTLSRVAHLVGVSRPTIHAWEADGHPALIRFWSKRGFYT